MIASIFSGTRTSTVRAARFDQRMGSSFGERVKDWLSSMKELNFMPGEGFCSSERRNQVTTPGTPPDSPEAKARLQASVHTPGGADDEYHLQLARMMGPSPGTSPDSDAGSFLSPGL